MNVMKSLIILGMMVTLICAVSATIDFTNWKEVKVDESLTNKTSTTVYTVMVPPGYTNVSVDSPSGPYVMLGNETDVNATILVVVSDNPVGQQLSEKNSNGYLDSIMRSANITPIEGSEPISLENGVVDYGTIGENFAGVYLLSNDTKLMVTIGFYKDNAAATAGIENLAMVANTIQIVEPAAESGTNSTEES